MSPITKKTLKHMATDFIMLIMFLGAVIGLTVLAVCFPLALIITIVVLLLIGCWIGHAYERAQHDLDEIERKKYENESH